MGHLYGREVWVDYLLVFVIGVIFGTSVLTSWTRFDQERHLSLGDLSMEVNGHQVDCRER